MTGIISWGSYIPKYRLKVEHIARVWGNNANSIKDSIHINEKSVPGIDEDTVTMSVEAARQAVKSAGINPKSINAVYIGSESHPYAVKPTGTIVAEALDIGNKYTTADLEFACKAGTAGIQIALALVDSGMIEFALVGGADTAQAAPGDALEYSAAAGGAMFVIGKDNKRRD